MGEKGTALHTEPHIQPGLTKLRQFNSKSASITSTIGYFKLQGYHPHHTGQEGKSAKPLTTAHRTLW